MRSLTGGAGRVLFCLLAVVVTVGAVAPAIGAADAASPTHESTVEAAGETAPLQVTTPANESNRTHHENPEEVSESGDLSEVRRWLAGRMGETLVDCTRSVQNPAQEAACERKNDEYPDWLGMYVDTVRETANENDDATAETFRDASDHQQTFREQVQQFRETRREYEQARENGDADRARRKARELLRLSRNVEQTGGTLAGDFRELSASTDLQLNDSATTVTAVTNETAQTAETVRADLFVETDVGVLSATETISFLDPLRVRGRLTAENGSALRNRTISLAVGSKTVRAQTDGNGDFTVAYRPTTLPLNATRVELTYVPRNESVFLGSSMSVPVEVEQVNADVSTEISPDSAGFGDEVSVTGAVQADGTGAANVPVVVSVGGRVLGRTATGDDGRYALRTDVPAEIPPGTQSVTARVDLSVRAIAAGEATTSIEVESTATTLSVDGTDAGGNAIRVDGRLTTVDGATIPARQVRLVVGEGRQTETVRTDDDGRFAGTVSVPQAAFDGDTNATVPVRVVFEGDGTNLEGSTAETTVRVDNASSNGTGGGNDGTGGTDGGGWVGRLVERLLASSIVPWVVGVFVVGLLSTGWYYRGRIGTSGESASEVQQGMEEATSVTEEQATAEATAPDSFELARERLDANEFDETIVLSYTTARESLASDLESETAQTHWEFYTDCRDLLDESRHHDLRLLTESYERAAFAAASLTAEDAELALGAAERLIDTDT